MSNLYGDSDDNVVELQMKGSYGSDFRVGPYGATRLINRKFKGKNGLVIFYSPNCGHCKDPTLVKTWKNLSVMFGDQFAIGAVNCTNRQVQNDKLAQFNKILGYPTIKFVYKDGTMGDEYTGGRDMASLKRFICREARVCK